MNKNKFQESAVRRIAPSGVLMLPDSFHLGTVSGINGLIHAVAGPWLALESPDRNHVAIPYALHGQNHHFLISVML